MSPFLLAATLLVSEQPEGPLDTPLELSTGAGILLNVSPYAASSSVAWELALHGDIASAWRWGVGARLGLAPSRGEAFARLLVAPRFQTWAPSAGLELGATARDEFGGDGRLLEEARTASLEGVSPWYVGVVSSPLSFRVWDRFRLSALDLEFGTHVAPLGRLVRLQVGFVSLGMDL